MPFGYGNDKEVAFNYTKLKAKKSLPKFGRL